jgi:hypothetical protein
MSLNRHAVQRDANEPEIVDALKRVGCTVWRLDIVDLLVGRLGKNYLLEVKRPGADLNARQKEMHSVWRGTIHMVKTVDDALKAVGAMQ